MSQQSLMLLALAVIIGIVFIFIGIWASRFVKVAPNEVLIVSGRKVHLPDGRVVGYRIVRGGGTFVFPVVERADVLSLEVLTVEVPNLKARALAGDPVQAGCVAQVKLNSDDASLTAAMEHLLGKSQVEIAAIVRPLLEKHLSNALGNTSLEAVTENPAACAAQVQSAVANDLSKMGLTMLGLSIRNSRRG